MFIVKSWCNTFEIDKFNKLSFIAFEISNAVPNKKKKLCRSYAEKKKKKLLNKKMFKLCV